MGKKLVKHEIAIGSFEQGSVRLERRLLKGLPKESIWGPILFNISISNSATKRRSILVKLTDYIKL